MQQTRFATKKVFATNLQQITGKQQQICNKRRFTSYYNIGGKCLENPIFCYIFAARKKRPNKVCDLSCKICCLFVTKQRKSLLSFSTFDFVNPWFLNLSANVCKNWERLRERLQGFFEKNIFLSRKNELSLPSKTKDRLAGETHPGGLLSERVNN